MIEEADNTDVHRQECAVLDPVFALREMDRPPLLRRCWHRPVAANKNFMDWLYLLIAGLLEVGWAIGLKYTQGFTRLWPSVGTIACMGVSFFFLSLALKTIPIGTGYAVWTGIGAVGTAILGMALFSEPRDVGRIVCLMLIVAGIAGLKLMAADGK